MKQSSVISGLFFLSLMFTGLCFGQSKSDIYLSVKGTYVETSIYNSLASVNPELRYNYNPLIGITISSQYRQELTLIDNLFWSAGFSFESVYSNVNNYSFTNSDTVFASLIFPDAGMNYVGRIEGLISYWIAPNLGIGYSYKLNRFGRPRYLQGSVSTSYHYPLYVGFDVDYITEDSEVLRLEDLHAESYDTWSLAFKFEYLQTLYNRVSIGLNINYRYQASLFPTPDSEWTNHAYGIGISILRKLR
jgi:hypothetical protein